MTSYAQGASMTEEDLIAALEQAQAGGTVELSGSVTLTSQLVIEKEIVLDGNGYTITKGEGEDVFPNNAGILVTAGATLRDLTVEGPNTNAEGWDNGEFGIKLYEAQGGPAPERHRGAGQRRNQVSGGSVTLSGTIDVSNNEFGGIEVCREAQLDLTQARSGERERDQGAATLWSDSGKGTIRPMRASPCTSGPSTPPARTTSTWTRTTWGWRPRWTAPPMRTLAQALEAAGLSEGDKTVTLLKDVAVDSGEQAESRASGTVLTLPAGVTLNGQGHTVSYAGEAEIDSLLAVDGADSAIRNACFADGGKAQHVLTFSGAENARLEGVTVQGGQTAAIW